MTFRAKPHRARLEVLDALAEKVQSMVRTRGRSTAVSIELHGKGDSAEIAAIVDAVEQIDAPPEELHRVSLPGPSPIRIRTVGEGKPRLLGDLDCHDVVKVIGKTTSSGAAIESLCAVGVFDNAPSDWTGVVRRSLNEARQQFQRGRCNIICFEVADMSYFVDKIEIQRVFKAVEQFLDNDTRRVSGVIATSIGVIPDRSADAPNETTMAFRC